MAVRVLAAVSGFMSHTAIGPTLASVLSRQTCSGSSHAASRGHVSRRKLERLYREECAGITAYLTCLVGSENAHDLAQDVFVRAATSNQLGALRNPAGYLRRIARNIAIDFYRRRGSRIVTLPLAEEVDSACRAQQDDRIRADDVQVVVDAVLADLPARTARIFVMNRFEEKTYRQIHQELGIALQTVDYHMMRALARLRAALGEEPGASAP